MVGVVDLDTVEWNFGSHLVKQGRVIESEPILAAAWMRNQAHSPTAMGRIDRLCHPGMDRMATSLANHSVSSLPVTGVPVFAPEAAIVRSLARFPAILR